MKGISGKVSGLVLRDSWSLEPPMQGRTLVSSTSQGPESGLSRGAFLKKEGVALGRVE